GNISVLLVALSAVIWRFRDRPIGAFALAVAGAIRYPFGVVVLAWAVARRWKPIAWTALFGAILFLATLAGGGVQSWIDYARTIRALGSVSGGVHTRSFATGARALAIRGAAAPLGAGGLLRGRAAPASAAPGREKKTATVVALTATILTFPFFHPHYLAQLAI